MNNSLNVFETSDVERCCLWSYDTFQKWCRKHKLMNYRAPANMMYIPTSNEHWANTTSHAVMIIPSILAGEFLVWKSGQIYPNHKNYWNCMNDECNVSNNASNIFQPSYAAFEFCSRAYGTSLVGLFVVSSLFHWITWTQSSWKKMPHAGCNIRRPSLTKVFHVCDRTTIYFFIAGSYSPWLMLHEIHHSMAWIQWGIWLLAILGTAYTFIFLEKFKLLEIIFYLFIAIVPGVLCFFFASSADASEKFAELWIGGTFYLVGVAFFKCDGFLPFAHAIWHLFVAAGAVAHFVSVYRHFYAL